MAGGLGSRYKGLKQVDGITENGATVLEFSMYDALSVGFSKIVMVINEHIPASYLNKLEKWAHDKKFELHFVYQTLDKFVPIDCLHKVNERQKPWGTAHAVLCAKEFIHEPFVVINADDYYGKNAFNEMANFIDEGGIQQRQFAMVAYSVLATLSENGAVSRGICSVTEEGTLHHVIERTNIAQEGVSIFYLEHQNKVEINPKTLVSMNFWGFHPVIFQALEKSFHEFLSSNPNTTSEIYIPTQVQHFIDAQNNTVKVLFTTDKWYGMTYPEDKRQLVDFMSECIANNIYPDELWK